MFYIVINLYFRIKNISQLILVERMYNDSSIVFMLSGISCLLHQKNNSTVVSLDPIKKSDTIFPDVSLAFRYMILLVPVFAPINFLCLIYSIVSGKSCYFGLDSRSSRYFDDSIAIKCGIFWKEDIFCLKVFSRIVIEALYFIFIQNLVISSGCRIRYGVTGDTSYRYGYMSYLLLQNKVPVISNVNLNDLSFCNFTSIEQLVVDSNIPQTLVLSEDNLSEIQMYMSARFSGKVEQHDVLNAYCVSHKDLIIPEGKVVVSVFSHVFSDAPSSIPGKLHEDFHHWFVDTVFCLSKNTKVHLLVKEHPSAHLYNESGLVKVVLDKAGISKSSYTLVDDFNTSDVLAASDYIITCSGTVGLEGCYLNKQVVVASDVAFADSRILNKFSSLEDYQSFLINLGPDTRQVQFTKEVKDIILSYLYYYFIASNNRSRYLNFPLPVYVRGRKSSLDSGDYLDLLKFLENSEFSTDFCNLVVNGGVRL